VSDVSSTGLSETLANAVRLMPGISRAAIGAEEQGGLNNNQHQAVHPAGTHLIPDPRATSPLLMAGLRGGAGYEVEDGDVREIMRMASR
jgi:hypothetical protein